MNRKYFWIAFVLVAIAGCKKDNEKQEYCRVTDLAISATHMYEINYGDNEKISSLYNTLTTELSSYKYKGDTTTITATLNGNFQYRMIVTNNSARFATNVLIHNNESGTSWYNQKFSYDGNKVMSNKITDSGGDSAFVNYIWENGNPVILVEEGKAYSYEYYTDKKFQAGDWRDIQQIIGRYRIYEYKNLVKSSEVDGKTTYFTYNFDEAGRITHSTSTSPSNSTTFKIEYDCD